MLQGVPSAQDASGRDSLFSSLSTSLSGVDLASLASLSNTEDCIDCAFTHLKWGKSNGTASVANHLIHALPAVRGSLASLFTTILSHSYMPKPLRDCILVPIPKANKDPANLDNYRLAPSLSKALEWCILLLYPDYFSTSGLQFGFRANTSTTLPKLSQECCFTLHA